MPFVSLTVCQPSTTNCTTIDHILVDTGSVGLRLFASQIPSSVALPQQKDAAGNLLAECMQFFDGYTWGPERLADVQIGGERASTLPVQIIDPAYGPIPSDCSSTGASRNTPATLAANGVLGIGVFLHDCGYNCVGQAVPGTYYACVNSGCSPIALAENLQVAHPVSYFSTDNNGLVLSLPSVAASGAASVSGELVFGIGTQANNGLGGAQIVRVNKSTGTFTTVLAGTTFPSSIIDSGSTGLFFKTDTMPVCAAPDSDYYCPTSIQPFSATNEGVDGATSPIAFNVESATSAYADGDNLALPLLAGPAFVTSKIFDWGLPFFYGRTVYVAIELQGTPGGFGPYFAY